MKLNQNPRVPVDQETARWMREVAYQVNGISEGKAAALYQSAQSVPTTGTFAQGDFVTNNNPVEAGTAGNKYVVRGWICLTGGTPGTWVESRTTTGN